MRMTKFTKLVRKQHEKPPTNEMTAAVLDNKIFVFGGFTGGSDFAPKLKDILRYNTAYHTWKDDERWWREDSTMQLRRWVTCQKSVCNYCWKLWWGLSERNLLLLLCDLFCWVMSSFLFCVQIFPFKDLLSSNKLIELHFVPLKTDFSWFGPFKKQFQNIPCCLTYRLVNPIIQISSPIFNRLFRLIVFLFLLDLSFRNIWTNEQLKIITYFNSVSNINTSLNNPI